MKILHVMSSCSKTSGVAQMVMNYYRGVSKRDVFDFLLFWRIDDSFEDEIKVLGGSICYTGAPKLKTGIKYIKTIKSFFHEHRGEYDAVHLHELYLSGIILPIAKKENITVLIAHSHAASLSESPAKALRNRIMFFPARLLASGFLACSNNAGKAAFGRRVIYKKEYCVINNAFNIDNYVFSESARAQIRNEYNISDNLVIGHVGRFALPKNHAFLLSVFFEIIKENPSARLLLIGDGNLKEAIRKQTDLLNLSSRVIFAGQKDNIGEFLSAMDVFVFPSFAEGLGNAVIEAQCNGLPCVVSTGVPNEAIINSNCYRLTSNAISLLQGFLSG